jgi:integrase
LAQLAGKFMLAKQPALLKEFDVMKAISINPPRSLTTQIVNLVDSGEISEEREPTAREVNRRIRAEVLAEKRAEQSIKRSEGAALGVLARVQKKHRGDPHAQVSMFLREFSIYAGVGRRRPVSQRTSTNYRVVMHQVLDELRHLRMGVQNLGEIGQKHVIRLTKHWQACKQAPATIQNKVSVMRRFLTMVGKPNAIPQRDEWRHALNTHGVEAPDRRETVLRKSKAWKERGVDFKQIVEKVRINSAITAMQLEVQAAFGLRALESMELDPRAADHGDDLRLLYGTKGGRPRDVEFKTSDEGLNLFRRDVLERAKAMAKVHPKGRLARKGYSLDANVKHFYYQMRKVGVTRKDLGVTAHGLRHEYMTNKLEDETGLPAFNTSCAKLHYTREEIERMKKAEEKVTSDAGHAREYSSRAYVGSHAMMQKERRERVEEWIRMTEENAKFQAVCEKVGATHVWLVGRFSTGLEVRVDEPMELAVRFSTAEVAREKRKELKLSLDRMFARGANIVAWIEDGQPDGAMEIFLKADGENQDEIA